MAVIHRDSDYAIRALVQLSVTEEVIAASEMAEQEDVPEHFLRKIMQRLKDAELVDSTQGPFGGYSLAADPAEVSLLDIVEAIQGRIVVNACFDDPSICDRLDDCPVHEQLADLQGEIETWMRDLTLADIVSELKNEETGDEQPEMSRTG